MNNPASDPAAPYMNELSAIRDFLTAALDSLKTGYMPDITSLDKRMNEICLKLQIADEAVQKQCLPHLSGLLQSLDECERGLRQWHAANIKTGSNT